ncbi:MAG: hypothetical protein SNH94_02515 [Rikenellaceae bacterium]
MLKIKSLKRYILVVVAALSLSSCAEALSEKISIEGYDKLEVMGFAGVKADIEFRNQSARKITLREVVITIKQGGEGIVTLAAKDEIVIPRRTESVFVPTIWRLSDVNIMAALSASKRVLAGDAEGLRVDIDAKVKMGLLSRKYHFADLSMPELMKSLNLDK